MIVSRRLCNQEELLIRNRKTFQLRLWIRITAQYSMQEQAKSFLSSNLTQWQWLVRQQQQHQQLDNADFRAPIQDLKIYHQTFANKSSTDGFSTADTQNQENAGITCTWLHAVSRSDHVINKTVGGVWENLVCANASAQRARLPNSTRFNV